MALPVKREPSCGSSKGGGGACAQCTGPGSAFERGDYNQVWGWCKTRDNLINVQTSFMDKRDH